MEKPVAILQVNEIKCLRRMLEMKLGALGESA
jgi:hypothetical protein